MLVEIRIVCPIKTCSQLSTNSQCSGNARTYLTLTQSIYLSIFLSIYFFLSTGQTSENYRDEETHAYVSLSVV